MEKAFFILLILSTFNLSAQNYDLIVKTNKDSIACRIDSITDTRVYFEMKYNDSWIHTDIDKSAILEYKYDIIDRYLVDFKKGSSYIDKIREPSIFTSDMYSDRYLFAPTALGMKKGTKSYNTYGFLLHDIKYGYSDRFSFAVGTVVLSNFYFIPTYIFPINEKSSFAVGDLLMISPYPDLFFFGNLLYGLYTRGDADNNFSVGAGVWTTLGDEIVHSSISPAITLSASLKMAENTYFLTENYYVAMNRKAVASYDSDEINMLTDNEFSQNTMAIGGIIGFRIIGKKRPQNSWQFGAIYILLRFGEVPSEYKQAGWDSHKDEGDIDFVPIPFFSYTRKF